MSGRLPFIDYPNHPAYGRMFEPDPVMGARLERELAPLITWAAEVEERRALRVGSGLGGDSELARRLSTASVAQLRVQGSAFEALAQKAGPVVATVRQRIADARSASQPITFKLGQELVGRDANPSIWKAGGILLREAGVFDAAQAYYGADGAKLSSIAVMVNCAGQAWSTNLFKEPGIETPPTVGFHIDSDGACVVKTVLYLNDVGPDQGPFSIVPESHGWERSGAGRIHRRAYDKCSMVSRVAPKRRAFVSLPSHLQVKAEFGGDILPGSAACATLIGQAVALTGPRGTLNVFDPEAIHRGGQVNTGERVVILASVSAKWNAHFPPDLA